MWPTGLGFEYFFGYVGPETDQFRPNLVRGTNPVPNDDTMQLLDARLADDAINWLHNQSAPGNEQPFFIYFSPSSTHAPHQAPADTIARFKGKFDAGWDVMRVESWRRQIAMGIIPANTKLTPRPDGNPAWDSLNSKQKQFASRSMEVAAAMLAYQDEQIGRILNEMERMGVMDNTLIALVLGDTGASADQGPEGTFNRSMRTNRIPESQDWRIAHIDDLGGPDSYANYEAGWSWAMNTPLRWTKQFGSMLGGIRNGLILSYPGHVKAPGSVCAEFGHVIDIAPTVLHAAKIPAPEIVRGTKQKPIDGQSLLPSLESCAPDRPRTQYFEIGGKKALWHNGWFASQDDGRKPWDWVLPADAEQQTGWTLYNLNKDFSQSTDVSAKYPDRLQEMVGLWDIEAKRNNVYPVDHSFGAGRKTPRPVLKYSYTFWGKSISIPTTTGPSFVGRSFTVEADLDLANDQSSGVIMALGSKFTGWSLFLDEGKPTFVYALSLESDKIITIASDQSLPAGVNQLRFTYTTDGLGKPADVSIFSGSTLLASGHIPATFMIPGGAGETLDTGRDTGVPVTRYKTQSGAIEGDIRRVQLTFPQ